MTFSPRRGPSGARPAAAVVAAGAVMMAVAVLAAAQWPASWLRGAPIDATNLDYSSRGKRLARLSDQYLRDSLGRPFGSVEEGALAAQAEFGGGSGSGSSRRRVAPRVVAHKFSNDDFEDAYTIEVLPFSGRTDTSRSTRQRGESSGCLPAGGTAWYRYTARADSGLFADTFGTSGPSALAVYEGRTLGTLREIGCDANVLGNAQVGFIASKGATYFFQVSAPTDGSRTIFELSAVGPTTIETLSPSGARPDAPADSYLNHPDISADGRWVVFVSFARNLSQQRVDCGGALQCHSLYLRDRSTGTTTLIATAGTSNAPFFFLPSLSPEGRYIGFTHWELRGSPGFHGPADAQLSDLNVYLYDRTTGAVEMVSRNSANEAARSETGRNSATSGASPVPVGGSLAPSISSGGRYVVFTSDGANLGGHVEPGKVWNVYRRDRVTGTTRLVSVDGEGRPMRANSFACTGRNISGDGRYVFFASTLGTGHEDTRIRHLYLWDEMTGRTKLVTKLPEGVQTRGSYCPSISLDGSRTAFVSRDPLIRGDTNETPDVYAYDVATEQLRRVSVTSAGEQIRDPNYAGTDGSEALPRSVSLSADGRLVAFDSAAPELVPPWIGGTQRSGSRPPGPIHVYVHDIVTGATAIASISSVGEALAGNSVVPYLSADGRSVAFMNSGEWTTENSVSQLDVMVHEL